jgi:hypothetical protein
MGTHQSIMGEAVPLCSVKPLDEAITRMQALLTTTQLPPWMVLVYLVTPLISPGNVPYLGPLSPTLLSLGSHYHSPIPGAACINLPDKKAHLSGIQ